MQSTTRNSRIATRLALLFLSASLGLAAGLAANQTVMNASATAYCLIDDPTKLKNVDPLNVELFMPAPGGEIKVTGIVSRYPVDPRPNGFKKPRGKADFNWFGFNGVTQNSFGRDRDKFNVGGNAAAVQKIPGNNFFVGANVDFAGSQKQPGGTDIEVDLFGQRISAAADPSCFDLDTLCIGEDNRFKVEVDWRDFEGNSGFAVPVATGLDSGTFFFLNPENTELLLKVLDACDYRGSDHFWVFYAATTNVEFEVTVTDTQTNQSRVYDNPLGRPAPAIQDTQAFATCP